MRTKTPFLAERMLAAAGRLFGTRRFHEVRMEDIAAEAEVSKGTLYRYFEDKEEMYLALLEQASQQLLERLELGTDAAETCRERLMAVVDAVIGFFDEHPHLFDLIQRAELAQQQGRRFPWHEVRARSMQLVLDIFEEGQRTGEFHVRHPQTAMLMFLGGMRAVIRVGTQPRPEDLAEQIVDDLLHGAASST